jgi:chloramphenicol 3-O phosphotransferase
MKKKIFERIDIPYKPSGSGKVILLNGASCSGKTSIAKALQGILLEAYLHVSLDTFTEMLPERIFTPGHMDEDLLVEESPKVVCAFNRALPVIAKAGNNIIVDHVLQHRRWLEECVEALIDLPVVFVGVKCPLRVLKKRESERKDRISGMVKYQYAQIHKYAIYDLEVNTANTEPKKPANAIKKFVESGKPLTGLAKTKENFQKIYE